MISNSDLSKISQISPNIFLSGIHPLNENKELVKKLNITCILACLDRKYLSETHDQLMLHHPDITILYLPYYDHVGQNLWMTNHNDITMFKYIKNNNDYNVIQNQLIRYDKKPMIEIGYHFIDQAISNNENVLIHCMAGMSRSVSLVSYYLMKKYHIDFPQALQFIKERRPLANPNASFCNQLKVYQNKREQFNENDASQIISSFNTKT